MNDERYKQLMDRVGMPNSRSLLLALQQVANEVAQEEQARDNWISVDDRLPEELRSVLVGWHHDEAGFVMDLDCIEEGMWSDWFNQAEHMNIAGGNCPEEAPYTHWQPLPQPTKL